MPDVLLVALSARALAASARRAGLAAVAVDLFGDADTRALALDTVVAERSDGFRFTEDALLAALAPYAGTGVPLVLGTGFEDRPELVDRLAARHPVAGAGGAILRRLKDPFAFAKLLAELEIPHPAIYARAAPEGVETLAKRAGAAGGSHIRPARRVRGGGRYLQERVPGCSVSALMLASGERLQILGFTEQWVAPSRPAPFRYGGAAGPIALPAEMAEDITAALARLVAATELRGLVSADLLIDETGWTLLEINPRPGATLDVFDHAPPPPLLGLHLAACAGVPPEVAMRRPDDGFPARAAGLLYAPQGFEMPDLACPTHIADRAAPGTRFRAGDPVCTVIAEGVSAAAARQAMDERRAAFWERLRPARRRRAA